MIGSERRSERGMTRWAVALAVSLVLLVGLGAVAVRSGDGPVPGASDDAPAADAADLELAEEAAAGSEPATDPDADPVAEPVDGAKREVEWVSARAASPVEAVPAERRVPKPDAVRGIYVGSWSVGNTERFERLVDLADRTEVNAFVIDVKDVTGEVSYASRVPLARQVGATDRLRIADVRERLERLREHDIYPIARIVVFKDPLLANARPEWAIQRSDGSVWADNKDVAWVDSFNRDVWDYNIELAREAIALGFSEIQWDYIRFPDAPASYLREAVYPARDGRTMSDGIREFMIYSGERLADLDVPLTADVFGVTTSAGDIGIGQVWEKMSDVVDVLLPMVYPSHYPRGSWNFPNPNAAPYQIVKKAMDHGVRRSAKIESAATIRPWLQAFSMGTPDYTPRYVRAQIDAVYDAGLTEWILWSPSARYNPESFASASGEEPWFAGTGASLYEEPEAAGERSEDRDRSRVLGTPARDGH